MGNWSAKPEVEVQSRTRPEFWYYPPEDNTAPSAPPRQIPAPTYHQPSPSSAPFRTSSSVSSQASSSVSHIATQQSQNTPQNCNVFVRNLDRDINQEEMKNAFSRYGQVTSCRVVRDANGACKGFAFVNFYNAAGARNAVQYINNANLSFNSRPLHVEFAREKENESGIKIFVSNLDYNINEDSLKILFEGFETISYMKLHTNESGRSKGTAIIRFDDEAEAVMAMTGLNGVVICGRPVRAQLARDNQYNYNNGARTNQTVVNGQPKERNRRGASQPKPAAASPALSPTQCVICLEAPLERVFSCGHAACAGCASRLSTCHICRQAISSRMPLFI